MTAKRKGARNGPRSTSGSTIGQDERAARGYQTVSYSLPVELVARVTAAAARRGETRSAVVSSALTAALE